MKMNLAILPLLLMTILVTVTVAQDKQFEVRTWEDSTQTYAVEARLVEYDRPNRIVILEKVDGTFVRVPLKKLCYVDRQYVLRELTEPKKRRPKKDRDDTASAEDALSADNTDLVTSEADPSNAVAESKPRKEKRSKRNVDLVNLYGVNWVRDMDDASVLAGLQSESKKDDKPIVWFRVLGDLEGFM